MIVIIPRTRGSCSRLSIRCVMRSALRGYVGHASRAQGPASATRLTGTAQPGPPMILRLFLTGNDAVAATRYGRPVLVHRRGQAIKHSLVRLDEGACRLGEELAMQQRTD